MPFENFDEAVLFNEKLSLEIPEEAVKMPTMPEDISLDTVYVVDGKQFTDKTEAERYQKPTQPRSLPISIGRGIGE